MDVFKSTSSEGSGPTQTSHHRQWRVDPLRPGRLLLLWVCLPSKVLSLACNWPAGVYVTCKAQAGVLACSFEPPLTPSHSNWKASSLAHRDLLLQQALPGPGVGALISLSLASTPCADAFGTGRDLLSRGTSRLSHRRRPDHPASGLTPAFPAVSPGPASGLGPAGP